MQRGLALLSVLLCAAQPSACDQGVYSPPPIAQPYATTLRGEPLTRPPIPESVLIELPEAEAWRRVKSTLGSRVLVLRPTTLPDRFDRSTVMLEYAYFAGDETRYRIGYRAAGALVNFAAGAVNSGPPTSRATVDVRGAAAAYETSDSWPERQIQWIEGANWSGADLSEMGSAVRYSIQSRGITEAELMQIAHGLVAVP